MFQNCFKRLKELSILLVVCSCCLFGFAQQKTTKTVAGRITNSTGEPLAGASVVVKNNESIGTISDQDGFFNLKTPENSILIISFSGYLKQELPVSGTTMNIKLQDDGKLLKDVIVVGYGRSTKKSLTSAVSVIKTDQLEALPLTNITQGLAGRAAGLIVQGSGGGINKTPTLSIRGGGTPLVVIDGIIRSYADFVAMPPEDVESITLLKDASATAIYGSRAGDGIIQITTKTGKSGKAQLDYNYNYSLSQPAIWPKPLNSWERAEFANLARANDNLGPAYSQEAIDAMKNGTDPLNYANTDWRRLVLNKFAPQAKHGLRLTGGSETNKYFISLGYIDQESLYKSKNHNMQRYNYRISQSSEVKSIGLKTTVSLDGYFQTQTHPYTSSANSYFHVFGHIQNRSPLSPGINKYGLPYNSGDNPVAETASDAGYNLNKVSMINGNLALEWSVPWVKGLKLRTTGNYRYTIGTAKQWRKDAAKYNWDSRDPLYDQAPMLYNSTNKGYTYTIQTLAEYSKSYGKHDISLLGGYEGAYGFNDQYWLSRENFPFPIDQITVGAENTQKNGGSEAENGRAGYMGQLKYAFNNRYFIEGSIRYDGSDNFPTNRRWGTFYSGSIAWSLLDEKYLDFLKKGNLFSTLKVRASYGQVGLDNWGSPFSIGRFAYLSSYAYNAKGWVVNGVYVPTFSEGPIPSPDISWFTTEQFDIGFDFGLMNEKLYGSVDYFFYKTKGFLYSPNPLDVGYTDPLGQALPKVSTDGEYRRAGFDFKLGYRNNLGGLYYHLSANLTKFDALWANNPSEEVANVMNPFKRNAQHVGYYGNMYRSLGYYSSPEDVLNSAKRLTSYDLTAGDIKYNDFNGDGKLDAADLIRSGKNSFPRANYGFNLALRYKGFFFNTLLQGATRFDMYLTGTINMNSGQTQTLPVIYGFQNDFWTPTNNNALFPRLMSNSGLNGGNNYVTSDFWLVNGAYLRVKDFQFGYDFKKILAKNTKWMSKAIVALSGQNILTFSEAVKYGLDPENASVQSYAYPNERVFALNINIGF